MKLKSIATIIPSAVLLVLGACTTGDETIEFGTDQNEFSIEAVGGVCPVRISSNTEWIATSDNPWITITPANGRGSADCRILIDSALTVNPREGFVIIEQQNAEKTRRRININQKGFDYAIEIENDSTVEIENFAEYDTRYFDLTVRTNVDFDIEIPEKDQNWLQLANSYKVNLNRGSRPREVKLRFNWGINSIPETRISDIKFRPKNVDESLIARNDVINVRQKAAEKIEENTRKGDSLALVGMQRSLGVWAGVWDTSTPMDEWYGVRLWTEHDNRPEGVEPGRVRSARFYLFATKDQIIPYEVQYLTACEELDFFSNINTFLHSFTDTGEYLPKLAKNLKRLFIDSFGYVDLPESFGELHNLELLSLQFNNFQKIPAVINGKNFPKLHSLIMNGNRRSEIWDLSTTIYTNYGGFVEEGRNGSPNVLDRLFSEFPQLDTLILGINYLHGEIPTFEGPEYDNDEYRYTEANTPDSLKNRMENKLWEGVDIEKNGKKTIIPRVMPYLRWFTINGNRFTGNLPVWLLYHPNFDEYIPLQLICSQEGRTLEGKLPGFDNAPANMEYYYEFYKGYKVRPSDDYFEDDTNTYNASEPFEYEGAARLMKWKGLSPDGK